MEAIQAHNLYGTHNNPEAAANAERIHRAASILGAAPTVAAVALVGAVYTAPAWMPVATDALALKLETNVASGASDFLAQAYVNKGNMSKWNPVSTAAATFIGNPFMASVPGGFMNLSYRSLKGDKETPMFNSPLKLQTWKSIGLNTLGNMLGDKAGGHIRGGYGELGIHLSSQGFGEFLGQQIGDVPSGFIDDATNEK